MCHENVFESCLTFIGFFPFRGDGGSRNNDHGFPFFGDVELVEKSLRQSCGD